MKKRMWIKYAVAILMVLIYFTGEATDLLFLAMLLIAPLGYWFFFYLYPDKPID
jgi:hypothetical protein